MLRIAVDLDGTLADLDAALQAEAERLFGPALDLRGSLKARPEGPPVSEAPDPTATSPAVRPGLGALRAPRLSARQLRELWAHVASVENFWTTLREIEPGAVARVAEAAAQGGWEVLFITTRPPSAGETTQVQSQRWLQAHGFELPSVFVVSGSRGRVATALTLDAVLDDRPENCADVASDSTAMPLLVWRDAPELAPEGAARLGIQVVFSIEEALQQLVAPRAAAEPGLLGRLRGALGV